MNTPRAKLSILGIVKRLPGDAAAGKRIEEQRWPGGWCSLDCGSTDAFEGEN